MNLKCFDPIVMRLNAHQNTSVLYIVPTQEEIVEFYARIKYLGERSRCFFNADMEVLRMLLHKVAT